MTITGYAVVGQATISIARQLASGNHLRGDSTFHPLGA
jgi:hypothetical protein